MGAPIGRPRLDRALVTGAVAGLRPFRPAGFRVELERVGPRDVVHDYGHGGSGVTLAPGTAMLAADLAAATPHRRAAVIGAGAVGLCAARELQRRGFAVTVYAAERTPWTTSNVAAALWGTFSLVDRDHEDAATGARIAHVSRRSFDWYTALSAERFGIRRVPLYLVGRAPELPWEMALTPELFPVQRLASDEHPFAAAGVLRTESLMIDPARFLSALETDLVAAGGRLVTRRFSSRDDVLTLEEPLLVNCAGLATRSLFGDESLEPIKGELVLLPPQPEVDYAVVSLDEDAYVLPREHALVVGGSRLRGDATAEPRDAEIDAILQRAARLFR